MRRLGFFRGINFMKVLNPILPKNTNNSAKIIVELEHPSP